MNKTIFMYTFKRNYKLMIIFLFVLIFYQSAIILFIDPDNMSEIADIFSMADSFLGPLGINLAEFTSPLSYTASTFFSVLVLAFTMVFIIIESIGLVAKQVDDTSITCILMTAVKRSDFLLTKSVFLLFSLLILFIGIFVSGFLALSTFGEFSVFDYFILVLCTYTLCSAVAMLSFFLSVAFCDSKWGIRLAVATPIMMILIKMFSGVSEDIEWIKYISFYGYYDSTDIINGEVTAVLFIGVLAFITFTLMVASIKVFDKKNLSI